MKTKKIPYYKAESIAKDWEVARVPMFDRKTNKQFQTKAVYAILEDGLITWLKIVNKRFGFLDSHIYELSKVLKAELYLK
jgi:hypothetical protein